MNPVVVERDVMVPMRDGIRLASDIYRVEGIERSPVLLQRLPYGKERMTARLFLDPVTAATAGYAVVVQDSRGRFGSEGTWNAFQCEIQDGADAVEWLARQPWSNGEVGMFGGSGAGMTQFLALMGQPGSLRTIAPIIASGQPGQWFYRNGALALSSALGWALWVAADAKAASAANEPTLDEVAKCAADAYSARDWPAMRRGIQRFAPILEREVGRMRPLRAYPPLRRVAPWFYDWLDHDDPTDPYWTSVNLSARDAARADVTALHVSGWYDYFLDGVLTSYRLLREFGATERARRGQKLVIGPWAHGAITPTSTRAGEIDFGADAAIDLTRLQMDWFNSQLRDAEPVAGSPVSIFVMGSNVWRDESEWPIARTQRHRMYLHSRGAANTLHGDGALSPEIANEEPVDYYLYDPADPVPTCGGSVQPLGVSPGAFDQQEVEGRPDVLVYTSEPITKPTEVTGQALVDLWASTSAPDTDFTTKLVSVSPDGKAINLAEGIVRARYQLAPDGRAALHPNAVYRFRIELTATSYLFQTGYRIRLEISSSNHPSFEPNPNTGGRAGLAADSDLRVARQAIFHDARHPSHLSLPIIPSPT